MIKKWLLMMMRKQGGFTHNTINLNFRAYKCDGKECGLAVGVNFSDKIHVLNVKTSNIYVLPYK